MVVISHTITNNPKQNKKIVGDILEGYESRVKLLTKERKAILLFILLHKMGEVNWLITQHNNKKIPKSVFDEFMAIDPKQLEVIINQYHKLESLF